MSQTKAQLISDLVQALNFTGTSSAPANGMYLSAANTIKLATNSNGRLTIDSSGNAVFTGTCTATGLTVNGDVQFSGAANNVVWDTSDNALEFQDGAKLKIGSDDDIVIHHTGGYSYIEGVLRIGKNNNVRITDANDDTRLQVTNTGAIVTGTCTATTFIGALTGTASGNAVLTGSTNNQIVTITGANAIQGETKLTFSGALLDFAINNGAQGFRIGATGNHYPIFEFDANRSGAGNNCGQFDFKWDGTGIARIAALTGDDTTNKDNGHLAFMTSTAGSLAEALRIDPDGHIGQGVTPKTWTLGKALNVGYLENVLHGESGNGFHMIQNAYYNSGWKKVSADLSSIYTQWQGTHIFYTNATGSADDAITWQPRLKILATGEVGIGTTSPGTVLEVQGAQGYADSASTLATAVSKSAFRVKGSNNSSDSLWMGVETSDANPYIQGANDPGNASKKLLLNPFGGNVGIGTTTPSNGFLEVKNTSYNGGSTGLLTVEGGSESGVMFKTSSYGNDQHKIATNNNGHMFFRVAAGTRASLTSNGLCFNSDTAAANALDDYEEGTFTPAVTSGLSGGTIAYNSRSGRYTKIGNVVNFTFHMNISSCSLDSGQLKFGGLPITSVNNDSNKTGAAFMIISNGNIGSTNTFRVETNSTDLSVITGAGDAYAANSSSLDNGNRQIAFAGFYYAA